jgi:glycosyltransferase involved in cell wall biosynthesis
MRVLLAPSAYYPHVGGIEELTRQLALALQARGHQTAVLTNRWPDGVAPSEQLGGVPVTRLPFPLPSARLPQTMRFLAAGPSAARAVTRYVRNWQADVVHVIGAGPQSVYLGMLAGRLRAPLVFTTQGELSFDAQCVFQRSATLRAGLRRTVGRARMVTACSAFTLRNLETFVEPTCPSVVIPNGVDPDEFGQSSDVETEFQPYVLAVGRLVPQKGFDVLIDAFAMADLSSANLIIAGDGPEREALARRVTDLGIVDRVHLLGAVNRERLVALMHGAVVFALPSRGEAFGIALLEAMAAGVPSVAAAAGGVPELARDGENALVVDPENAKALSSALVRLLNDSELRVRLSAEGRETARELAWSRIVERYESVYAQAREGSSGN